MFLSLVANVYAWCSTLGVPYCFASKECVHAQTSEEMSSI